VYSGDSYVPLLWHVWHIPKGETVNLYNITQITPTHSFLLDTPLVSASNREATEGKFKII